MTKQALIVVIKAAAIVTILLGSRLGGVLLAFPAILPATLTLIEEEESEEAAKDDDAGAVLGAISLVSFAATMWLLLPAAAPAAALTAGAAVWLVTAVGLYVVVQRLRNTRRSVPGPEDLGRR